MVQDRKESNVKRCGRVIGPVQSRPGGKSGWRVDRLSVVRKGNDPSADMGDWVIDEAE